MPYKESKIKLNDGSFPLVDFVAAILASKASYSYGTNERCTELLDYLESKTDDLSKAAEISTYMDNAKNKYSSLYITIAKILNDHLCHQDKQRKRTSSYAFGFTNLSSSSINSQKIIDDILSIIQNFSGYHSIEDAKLIRELSTDSCNEKWQVLLSYGINLNNANQPLYREIKQRLEKDGFKRFIFTSKEIEAESTKPQVSDLFASQENPAAPLDYRIQVLKESMVYGGLATGGLLAGTGECLTQAGDFCDCITILPGMLLKIASAPLAAAGAFIALLLRGLPTIATQKPLYYSEQREMIQLLETVHTKPQANKTELINSIIANYKKQKTFLGASTASKNLLKSLETPDKRPTDKWQSIEEYMLDQKNEFGLSYLKTSPRPGMFENNGRKLFNLIYTTMKEQAQCKTNNCFISNSNSRRIVTNLTRLPLQDRLSSQAIPSDPLLVFLRAAYPA